MTQGAASPMIFDLRCRWCYGGSRMVESARRSRMRPLVRLLIAVLTCIRAVAAQDQPEFDSPKYQDVFYASGNLRIQAYLYKPDGDGPFPVVIYNHGTRNGRESTKSKIQ